MQSPYKKIVVYDLETGGFSSRHNSITEIAMVSIDMETLKITDEFSSLIKPRLDLSEREIDPLKEAKEIFKLLKIKDVDSNLNILSYKKNMITLKNLEPLVEDIEAFYRFLDEKGDIITHKDYLKLLSSDKYSDIIELYFNKTYNPQALEVTHMTEDLLTKEGVEYEECFKLADAFIQKNTIGNSRPILAGHNIKKFDNSFLEKLFLSNNRDLYKSINESQMIDTLEWARLKWFELPGFNLGTCANEVGLTLKEAHRALPDTIANAKFLIEMLKNLRGFGAKEEKYERRKYKFNF